MNLYSFTKYPQKFKVVVRAGDFSKNNIGPNEPPEDLLAALMNFDASDYMRCCKDADALLEQLRSQMAQCQEAAKRNDLTESLVQIVAQLDILHSFFHGGAVVAQMWHMQGKTTEPIFEGVAIEQEFADVIAMFGKAGLTSKLAYRAIHAGERAKNFDQLYNKKLGWLDVIEDPQPAN